MSPITFLRRKQVEVRTGQSRSTIYQAIADGTLTRPVSLGARAVGWPDHEIDAINRARLAGADKEALMQLVEKLHQARGAGAPITDQAA